MSYRSRGSGAAAGNLFKGPTPGESEFFAGYAVNMWKTLATIWSEHCEIPRVLWCQTHYTTVAPLSQGKSQQLEFIPPHPFTLPTSSLSVKHTHTCTYKHTHVYTPHTPGEQAGMELVPDFIGGDSFSHFSVWITSSSWAMRGNEHCSTTKSRFRLTELVLRPVGFRCCRTAPLPDRTPTTAVRDWCVCVFAHICVHTSVRVCVTWWSLLWRVRESGERERCVRFG